MNPGETERLQSFRRVLEARDRLLRALRDFFHDRGFLEVETPVRIAAPAPEVHIEAEPAGTAFLRASPELHMKRLLAARYERLFQLGPCFRRGERGDRHHPEYSMLEWYRAGADYVDLLADAKALLLAAARAVVGGEELVWRGQRVILAPIWERITVSEAFRLYAGWDPVAQFDADRFDFDLVEKVEPRLPHDVPVVLTDYPAAAASLARLKPAEPRVAERWELYVGGMELANAYSELIDPVEQRARFEAARARRAELGRADYPEDTAFFDALEAGLPACAGCALGVDRLLMLLTDSPSLDFVLPFREG